MEAVSREKWTLAAKSCESVFLVAAEHFDDGSKMSPIFDKTGTYDAFVEFKIRDAPRIRSSQFEVKVGRRSALDLRKDTALYFWNPFECRPAEAAGLRRSADREKWQSLCSESLFAAFATVAVTDWTSVAKRTVPDEEFLKTLDKLDPITRDFFLYQFAHHLYQAEKEDAVAARMLRLMKQPTIDSKRLSETIKKRGTKKVPQTN
jgi:hypothetical protein